VYLLSDESNLYALNAGTGAVIWKYSLGGQSFNLLSLALANDVLYLGYNSLYAFEPLTGTLLWNSPALGLGSPAVADGVVYTTSFAGLSAFSLQASRADSPPGQGAASERPDPKMLRPDFNLRVSEQGNRVR
jgi:eukaryotic-like serine/threonine-protein kinase